MQITSNNTEEMVDLPLFKRDHFISMPISYDGVWVTEENKKEEVLQDIIFREEHENNSWSAEIEEIHEEPTKNGWIDVYEREAVLKTVEDVIGDHTEIIVEFGASSGYMIAEMKNQYPQNYYIATDLMDEGLKRSYKKRPDIMHLRCDFTNAPFRDECIDFIYSLNVLEHIDDDVKTISECYRSLKPGGHCLFVVPRGDKLYDYFDEMLFHKRRYAKGELRQKCETVGFKIEENFHFAWLCYPVFWLKKKWNRHIGKGLTQEEKIDRVKADVDNAMASPLAIGLMHFERKLSSIIHPSFGVREFILCTKE